MHLTCMKRKSTWTLYTLQVRPDAPLSEKTDIDKSIIMEIIELAKTKWAASRVFDSKKDRSLRICVGYRALSAIVVRNFYPILKKDEGIDSTGEALIFSAIVSNISYWEAEIDDADRDKTTLPSRHGFFRFQNCSLGLGSTPGPFKPSTNITLFPIKLRTS